MAIGERGTFPEVPVVGQVVGVACGDGGGGLGGRRDGYGGLFCGLAFRAKQELLVREIELGGSGRGQRSVGVLGDDEPLQAAVAVALLQAGDEPKPFLGGGLSCLFAR